jgi:hypothetical protein
VLLLVNFGVKYFEDKEGLSRAIPILIGDYTDFSALWYQNVGATLCITLSLNVFSPYAQRLLWPCLASLRRQRDRGCAMSVKKDRSDPADDRCNTRQEL